MKRSEILFGIIRIPIDFLMALLAFLIAYHLRTFTHLLPGINLPLDLGAFPDIQEYTRVSILASLALLFFFALNRMYSLKSTSSMSREMRQIFVITSIGLMVFIGYFFLKRAFPFSRLALIYTWILSIILISGGRLFIRLIQHYLLKAGIGRKNILFIGHNNITNELYNFYKKSSRYNIIGAIDEKQNQENKKIPFIGGMEKLEKTVKTYHIEEIIQTKPDLIKNVATEIRDFCRENQINFSFVPNLLEVQQTNIEMETFSGIPVITFKPTPLDGWGKVIKRSCDLLIAIPSIIILSPVYAIIAILIKLDSKGTVLFKYLDDGTRVKRVGEHGRLFNFYKFRSMYPKTHNLRYTKLAEKNTRKGSPVIKIKDDPRVTRIGKILRKTSFDELPQLFNVIKGEMSLVGPRPHLPEEVAKYQKHHKFVLTIKPGITGLAQISGRSNLNFEEEVRLDTYYIEHWSLWLDFKILLKTFSAVSKGYEE